MKIQINADIFGSCNGFDFEIPKDSICEVEQIKGDVVYFTWEDDTATVYKRYATIIK